VALSFVGATDKESIATIKALEAAYGPAWVNEWLPSVASIHHQYRRAAAALYLGEAA
jgi:type IV secretion system protein VirB4